MRIPTEDLTDVTLASEDTDEDEDHEDYDAVMTMITMMTKWTGGVMTDEHFNLYTLIQVLCVCICHDHH